jgi:gluconokinase
VRPQVIIVMGVSGSGKSTVGAALADALGWPFVDADDYHLPASVAKMTAGDPLTDADRGPWLDRLREVIAGALARGEPLVLACSALRGAYRRRLDGGDGLRVRFVHLTGPPALFRARLDGRAGHFMKAAMLESQLAALEPPEEALAVDAGLPVDRVVERVRSTLGL